MFKENLKQILTKTLNNALKKEAATNSKNFIRSSLILTGSKPFA